MPIPPEPQRVACPCGRPRALSECCEPLIRGAVRAKSAEGLMRSRYTAFTLGSAQAIDYLVETHHASFSPSNLHAELEASVAHIDRWTQLEILTTSTDGNTASVHFRATYIQAGQAAQLTEHSHFVREAGRWLYTTGEVG